MISFHFISFHFHFISFHFHFITKTGLLLIFGAFLAWETRNVTVPALNDSKNIGVSVYTVVLSCLVGLPVVNIISGMPDFTYTVAASMAIICSMVTLCLMFIPKVSKNQLA